MDEPDVAIGGMTRVQVYLLVGLLLLLSNVPLAFLIWLWPSQADLDAPNRVWLAGWSFVLTPERRILLCIAFCGLLGGSIRMLLRIRGEFSSPPVDARRLIERAVTQRVEELA